MQTNKQKPFSRIFNREQSASDGQLSATLFFSSKTSTTRVLTLQLKKHSMVTTLICKSKSFSPSLVTADWRMLTCRSEVMRGGSPTFKIRFRLHAYCVYVRYHQPTAYAWLWRWLTLRLSKSQSLPVNDKFFSELHHLQWCETSLIKYAHYLAQFIKLRIGQT